MDSIPPQIVEACYGVLLVILTWMIVFDVAYLIKRWWAAGMLKFYAEEKAAWALLVFWIGLWIRGGLAWVSLHATNSHHAPPTHGVMLTVLLIGTVISIIGGACWIRVITPVRFPGWFSVALIAVALIFGVGMAL